MEESSNPDTRLFRLIVLAILILVFITVTSIKIWEVRVAAERVGVLHTVGGLQSAIGIKLSELVIHEGLGAIESLHLSNPMRLWNPPPINYLGEFHTNDAPAEPGTWYFDIDDQLLVYRVRFEGNFTSNNPQYPAQARYQLQLDYHDSNNNQQFDPYIDDATGLTLKPVDNYNWLIEPQ